MKKGDTTNCCIRKMIKAVIFDLDDTLYDYKALDREAGSRVKTFVCKRLEISEERYEEAFLHGRKETKDCLGDTGASHNRMLYYQKTLEYLDYKPLSLSLQMYEMYWGTFLTKMQLYPGVRELLDVLHEMGMKIGICTDLTAHIQHRKLEALGLVDDVDCLVTSEEAGREKPAPEIFALCLEKLKMKPAEVCFVGDSYRRDVLGAVSAGMHAVWFCPGEEQICREDAKVYDIVKDYGQLRKLLDMWEELER